MCIVKYFYDAECKNLFAFALDHQLVIIGVCFIAGVVEAETYSVDTHQFACVL